MLKHLLLVHGMRRGNLNERLSAFIDDLMSPHETALSTAFLESEQQNPYIVIERLIAEGATHIVITPLLILSASHMKEDAAEIVEHFKWSHPRVQIDVRPTLAHHPLTKEIVKARITAAGNPDEPDTGIVVIAHGNARFPETDEELESFTRGMGMNRGIHPLMLYGNLSFEALLPEISKGYRHLIVVPLFLYDGYLVNKMKERLHGMNLDSSYEVTPSLNFDPLLKRVVMNHMAGRG